MRHMKRSELLNSGWDTMKWVNVTPDGLFCNNARLLSWSWRPWTPQLHLHSRQLPWGLRLLPEFDSICSLRAALVHSLQELTQSQVRTLKTDPNTNMRASRVNALCRCSEPNRPAAAAGWACWGVSAPGGSFCSPSCRRAAPAPRSCTASPSLWYRTRWRAPLRSSSSGWSTNFREHSPFSRGCCQVTAGDRNAVVRFTVTGLSGEKSSS